MRVQDRLVRLHGMDVQVIANPADDGEFVRTVRELARRERSHRAFEANLRTRYPRASVRPSELSGSAGERWYVYRDGRWARRGGSVARSAAQE